MEETKDFLCAGTWDSDLDGDDDGTFDLEVDGSGTIRGTHFLPPPKKGERPPEIPVTGHCEHRGRHHITIDEERHGVKFQYTAELIPHGSGAHTTKDGRRRRPREKFDDEVWTGVRTTLVGQPKAK